MTGRLFGSGVALLVAGSALSCASGPMTLVGYKVPQRQQVAIVIDISEQVNQADDGGGVATLAETLANHLKEYGIDSQLYASKEDHPKPPRVDIYVSYWHGTPRSAHQTQAATTGAAAVVPLAGVGGIAALAMAGNNIVLDCKVTLPGQEKPVFSRHFEKSGLGMGWNETDDNSAAESAGDAIARAILTR